MLPEGITDAEINHLRGMTKPTFLEITDSPIKGRGISVLRELQYLDPLCLINTDIGDDGIESIGLFNKGTVLNLSGSKITDTGMRHLEGLTEWEKLVLEHPALSGPWLDLLRKLRRFSLIHLTEKGVSEAGAVSLKKKLPHLQLVFR